MKVERLWFADNKIFIQTSDGKELWQSLMWYPRLLRATKENRADYRLSSDGIHWQGIDEDISFESFLYEDKEPGQITKVFNLHPELNVSAVARRMGIKQSLLAAYISGSKKPSLKRENEILTLIRKIGMELETI